jgi:uncharacterized lipoprotein YmbA
MVALALLLTGCSSDPPAHIYVLSPPAEDKRQDLVTVETPVLELQRIVVPDYLDTTDILLRIGANEIKASPTGRWGERLSQGLDHALSAALVTRLPQDRITLASSSDRSAKRLTVIVDAFDVRPDGRSVLTASWTILDPNPDVAPRTGRGDFATPAASGSTGDASIVAAMSQTIGLLADRIATDAQVPPS